MFQPKPLFDTGTLRNLILDSRNSVVEDVWSSERWTKRQREFLNGSLNGEVPRYSSLFSLFGQTLSSFDLIDFGGGSGWLLHVLERFSTPKSYTNIEKIDLHEECLSTHVNYQYLHINSFAGSILPSSNSLLYINSVLQYFYSEQEPIQVINAIQPKHVVLDDVTLSADVEFFSNQKYYENQIPYRFVDERILIKTMEELGYSILTKRPFERIISKNFSYDFDSPNNSLRIGETKSFHFRIAST